MRLKGIPAVAGLVALAGCATATYVGNEYGTSSTFKTVQMADGTGFHVRLHETKPRLLVSVDTQTATGMGVVSGLTYGAVSGGPVYASFDKAAQEALAELKPGCRAVNGKPLERVYYEYDVECPANTTPVQRTRTR